LLLAVMAASLVTVPSEAWKEPDEGDSADNRADDELVLASPLPSWWA